jgi:hypothetical protein
VKSAWLTIVNGTGIVTCVNPNLPSVRLQLWRSDAIVLFDWLMRRLCEASDEMQEPSRSKRE